MRVARARFWYDRTTASCFNLPKPDSCSSSNFSGCVASIRSLCRYDREHWVWVATSCSETATSTFFLNTPSSVGMSHPPYRSKSTCISFMTQHIMCVHILTYSTMLWASFSSIWLFVTLNLFWTAETTASWRDLPLVSCKFLEIPISLGWDSNELNTLSWMYVWLLNILSSLGWILQTH